MKSKTSLLIATAIAASIGFSAFAPAAFADQGKGSMHRGDRMEHRQGNGPSGARGEGRGGIMGMICSPEGAARVEKMLNRLDDRITLTDDQKALFEDFKTHALAAQTTYADTCIAPTRDGSGDMVTQLQHRQANMTAMVAAMDEVLPSLEAFQNGLTDEQKAQLKPQRGGHDKNEMRGKRHGGRGNN